MKALSGRQPWWWLLVHGGKSLENRKWNTSYRGPLLLHASKGCTADEYSDAVAWVSERFGDAKAATIPPLAELPRGGIVGQARLVDVVRPWHASLLEVATPAAISKLYPPGVDWRWHIFDQFAFVLEDAEPLPFTPCGGRLGLFELDETGGLA